nr:PQQ-binding-like beta-propeller repeat protein [Streptomyces sp. SID3343]
MKYPGSPAFHGGAAHFPGQDRWLQSVDLRTGRRRRSAQVQVCDGLLNVCADVLYAFGPEGLVHSIDLLSNEIRWSSRLGQPVVGCAPEVAAGHVIVMTERSRPLAGAANRNGRRVLAVLDATALHSWTYDPEGQLSPEWVVTDLSIYLVEQIEPTHQRIVAVDPTNGKTLWDFHTVGDLAAAPATANGLVIFGDVDNRLVALDARSGKLKWESKSKGRVLTRPFAADDTLFTADRAGILTAWRLSGGQKRRSRDLLLSPDRQGRPAAGHDRLYLTDSRGDIHALPTTLR